jgi:hypothetical protein
VAGKAKGKDERWVFRAHCLPRRFRLNWLSWYQSSCCLATCSSCPRRYSPYLLSDSSLEPFLLLRDYWRHCLAECQCSLLCWQWIGSCRRICSRWRGGCCAGAGTYQRIAWYRAIRRWRVCGLWYGRYSLSGRNRCPRRRRSSLRGRSRCLRRRRGSLRGRSRRLRCRSGSLRGGRSRRLLAGRHTTCANGYCCEAENHRRVEKQAHS